MNSSSANLSHISILVPLQTKCFIVPTTVKEIPDLAYFLQTGKLNYTP